ncbi:hypothetical protein EAH89_25550 [Roseomonas nepalensis]|uniref:Uncharacterized protein n=1 Tax=Muricoccus nepalensis TaxID=1854500 RepID=A0A502F9I7_9PROT|nr:hypothetical protein [Roseomonas nepalensis]TPG45991.1 hypothetical protein EAH89_25550 [Roseomonas nepalensis]
MLTMEEAEDLIARWEEADDELRADFLLDVIGRIDPTGDATHEWANNFEQDYVTGIEGGAVLAWGRDVGRHRELEIVRRADHSPGPLNDDEITATIESMKRKGNRLTIRGVTAVLKEYSGVTPSASRVHAHLRQHRGEQPEGRDPVAALRAQDAEAKQAARRARKAAAERKAADRQAELLAAVASIEALLREAITWGQSSAADGQHPPPRAVLAHMQRRHQEGNLPTYADIITETLERLMRAS